MFCRFLSPIVVLGCFIISYCVRTIWQVDALDGCSFGDLEWGLINLAILMLESHQITIKTMLYMHAYKGI